ncbi:MAG: hypothetical protein CL489_09080 [Acidobacteria bacterium]|nr:hypothetical protein [Acidobacteriota bacterium]|tara:strand:- start:21051 stop:21971 length:921 start_codon:yes stop_codon:yes gene_type:complete
MKFFKYPSLENHYRNKYIQKIRFTDAVDKEWVATEKLHGANYSIYWDSRSGEIRSAKRTGFIGEEKFFNHEQADRVVYPKIKECQYENGYLIFYGELCGGNIQKGVDYSEEQRFVCFDIAVVRDDEPDKLTFFSYDELTTLCDALGIERAPEIARGSFKDILQLDNIFNSKYGVFIAEGFVMKPVVTHWLPNGSRMAIKSKNSKFSEKAKSDKKPKKPRELSENETYYIDGVVDYLTENRLNNVISKKGEVDKSMFFLLMGELIQDAIEDFDKDNESNFKDLDKPERKFITKSLQETARDIVKRVI